MLDDVQFTQVSLSVPEDPATQEVVRRILADGDCWMTGSRWRGRDVVRISVSNWSTTEEDVERGLAALARAALGRAASVVGGPQRLS